MKLAALVMMLVALVIVASGCTSEEPDNSSVQDTSGSPESTMPSKIQIVVDYAGSWEGNYGDESGSQSVAGTGSQTFDIQGSPSIVSAVFQKMDDGPGTLTVKILKDGNVVQERSTSAPYGLVDVSASF